MKESDRDQSLPLPGWVVTVGVAVYPIGQGDYRAVDAAIEALKASGLEVSVGKMQSEVTGDVRVVFAALAEAYARAAELGGIVMTVTASNVCPA